MDEHLSGIVIGSAIEVHRHFGPGLLESSYSTAMAREFSLSGIAARRLVVELKTVVRILPMHRSQAPTCLRRTNCHLGLSINFNVPLFRYGLSRVVDKRFL